MASDDKLIITAAEAESLLHDHAYVHNFLPAGLLMLGCDYERADAIAAFKAARQIEIGGDGCKAMKHPLAVFDAKGKLSFFEADMAKVEAFEAARAS